MNKNIIFGFVFLLIVIAGIFLLKPAKKCSTDKPYLENGKCVTACASGKRDDKKCLSANQNCPTTRPVLSDGVCVSSCPSTAPVNISGVCKPCSSNTDGKTFLDNGVCVASCTSGKRDGDNCVTSCPSGKTYLDNGVCVVNCPDTKPYLDNGVCVTSCTSGKRDGDNCVTSCPSGKTFLDNGVCVASCPSGKRDGDNCVTSCPDTKPFLDNGVCVTSCPFYKRKDIDTCVDDYLYSSSTAYNVSGTHRKSHYAYDNSDNTFWSPSQGSNSWWLLIPVDPTRTFNSYEIRFTRRAAAENPLIPLTVTIYKDVEPSLISETFNASGVRQIDLSSITPLVSLESTRVNSPDTMTGNFVTSISGVRNFVVHFTHRMYLNEVRFS